jgi:hypothetical protein
MVSTDRIPVAGVGRVTGEANGRYFYAAELWTPVI